MNKQRTVSKPYDGKPPTIGFQRRENDIAAARIFCAEVNCSRLVIVAFDKLGLSDDTPFPEIATRRRWLCASCGSRKVIVMPDWPDPRAEPR